MKNMVNNVVVIKSVFEICKEENNIASFIFPFFNACNGGIMSLSTVFHYILRSVFSSSSVGRYHSISVATVYVINCNLKRQPIFKEK